MIDPKGLISHRPLPVRRTHSQVGPRSVPSWDEGAGPCVLWQNSGGKLKTQGVSGPCEDRRSYSHFPLTLSVASLSEDGGLHLAAENGLEQAQ